MSNLKTKKHYSKLEEYGFGPNVIKKNKVCSDCGAVVSSEFENCNICGTLLPKDTLFVKYVSLHKVCQVFNCVVKDDSHLCPQCGNVLSEDKTA